MCVPAHSGGKGTGASELLKKIFITASTKVSFLSIHSPQDLFRQTLIHERNKTLVTRTKLLANSTLVELYYCLSYSSCKAAGWHSSSHSSVLGSKMADEPNPFEQFCDDIILTQSNNHCICRGVPKSIYVRLNGSDQKPLFK